VYIDPTYSGPESGAIEQPYNAWTDVTLASGNTYLQKRGTTYASATQIHINSKANVTVGAYGSGSRPVFSYTGSGYAIRVDSSSNCTVAHFEVNGNSNAVALVGVNGTSGAYTESITIDNCLLYNAHNSNNAGFGVYGWYNNRLKVLRVVMHNVALDGMYMRSNPDIEIGYCRIYDINRRYFSNPNESVSSGDGIQLDGDYNGFHIHHTTLDRTTGAGNKFNLILSSAAGVSDNATGILEYCTFITDATVSSAVHIERGNGIITRYNTFQGSTQGIRLGGSATKNNLIHNNVFYDCVRGVGVGYTYSGTAPVGPCTGTKIYNNVFYHVTGYHIWVDKTAVETRNNIHMRATDPGVALYNYGGGSWTLANNCYSDAGAAGTPGTGSSPVIGDPLFVNAAARIFRLQAVSPCIDKGVEAGIALDPDGTAIPVGAAPDIGAFEFNHRTPTVLIVAGDE
jgi:parallel beta-helix repeat protein